MVRPACCWCPSILGRCPPFCALACTLLCCAGSMSRATLPFDLARASAARNPHMQLRRTPSPARYFHPPPRPSASRSSPIASLIAAAHRPSSLPSITALLHPDPRRLRLTPRRTASNIWPARFTPSARPVIFPPTVVSESQPAHIPQHFLRHDFLRHNTARIHSGIDLYCLRGLRRPNGPDLDPAGTPSELRRNSIGTPLELWLARRMAQKKNCQKN